ncbi:MAG: hypothetical protein IKO41_01900 [Lachnospiraceae bacterium]|nr:hypothetical protein [Lachnospiraceae bacterium]
MPKSGTVRGIRWSLDVNGDYRFAALDIGGMFGMNMDEIIKYCPLYRDMNVGGCKNSIDFNGLITIGKNVILKDSEFLKGLTDDLNEMVKETDFSELYEKEKALRMAAEAKVLELQEILGDGVNYKIVDKIPWINEVFNTKTHSARGMVYRVVGGQLARLSRSLKIRVKYTRAFGYGHAMNMYRTDVVDMFYDILRKDKYKLFRWRNVNYIFNRDTQYKATGTDFTF